MNHAMDLARNGVSHVHAGRSVSNEVAEVDLWHLQLDATAQQTEAAGNWLERSEQAQASRFRNNRDRVSFIVRRAMRRFILSRYLQVDPGEVEIAQTAGGPPRLTNDDGLQFSTAHRGSLGVMAVTRGATIGVDIEPVIDPSKVEDLVASCLHPSEGAHYHELDTSDRALWFTQIWTRKEALLKMLGVGFAIEPGRLCVLPSADTIVIDERVLPRLDGMVSFEPWPGWCGSCIVESARDLTIMRRTLGPGVFLQDA